MAKNDVMLAVRIPCYIVTRLDEVAAKWGLNRAVFLRMLIERAVFGDFYSFEGMVKAAIGDLVNGGTRVNEVEAILELIKDVVHQVAKERR